MFTNLINTSQIALSYFPQPLLVTFGLCLLAGALPCCIWFFFDRRSVGGESPALKPLRFFLSLGSHLIVLSFYFNFVKPQRIDSFLPMLTVWISIVSCSLELSFITLQAIRGRKSHFGPVDRFDEFVDFCMILIAPFFLMGAFPLMIEIALRPQDGANSLVIEAILIGFGIMQIFGGGTGIMMGKIQSSGVKKGAWRLPLFGWTLAGGDIRVPHFFAIHALEILPAFAGALVFLKVSRPTLSFSIFALLYTIFTIGLCHWSWITGEPRTARKVTGNGHNSAA